MGFYSLCYAHPRLLLVDGVNPFDPFALFSDRRQWLFISLYYVVLAAPFFCSGLALGLLFTRGTRHIHYLCAFDLVGAGIGCGALVLIMPAFGGSGSVTIAAAFGMMAAVVFGCCRNSTRTW